MQKHSSANTSINGEKLPHLYNQIDWNGCTTCGGLSVFDFGCGKFDNAKEFILSKDPDAVWKGYDPYNRTAEHNADALKYLGWCDVTVCANVLNVIDDETEIQSIADKIIAAAHTDEYTGFYFVSVYDGNKSGVGAQSKEDCWQRNEKISAYLKYFQKDPDAVVYKGIITNSPIMVDRR